MSKTLILGASGQVGGALAALLKAQGQAVALATSKPPTQADQVKLNLLTAEGLDSAFADVDRAFLMSPPGYTQPQELLGPVIAKARQQGLKKVVLMTAMGADVDDNSPMRQAEKLLEASGLPYAIIRPNWFMQNFHTFWLQGILQAGKIFLPVEQAKGSFIDARDIAAVAAELLFNDGLGQQAFNLTGAEALDHDQVAAILSEVTGKTITYEPISPEAMRENLLQAGLPADYTEFLLLILDAFRQGYAATVTPEVENILKRPAIRFQQYAEDHQQAWLQS